MATNKEHVVYKKTTKVGKGKLGDIMVNHPTKNKGKYDTVNLTKKTGAKTIKQGASTTKKFNKNNSMKNPNGYHMMPNGEIMKNSVHKKLKK